MAKNKAEINSVRLVVRELIKGKPLTTKEISKVLSEEKGEEINTRYVNNILAKISNKEKCNLGYFINREKEGNVYVYSVKEEVLALPEEKAYGLTLKTGKEKYTLDEALTHFPALKKYIDHASLAQAGQKTTKKSAKTTAGKKPAVKQKPAEQPNLFDQVKPQEQKSKTSEKAEQAEQTEKTAQTNPIEQIKTMGQSKINEQAKNIEQLKEAGQSKVMEQAKTIGETKASVEDVVTDIKDKIKSYAPEKSVYDTKFKTPIAKKSGKVPSYDGTGIYYEIIGEGDLVLAACNGIGVSTFFWKYLVKYFSPNCRIVLWDYRSHGKSDTAKDLDGLTIENCARDLKAVFDHNGIEKGVLLGHSMGCQTIFEFYRQFPERVSGLIPILGSYGNPLGTFLNTDKMIQVVDFLHPLAFKYPHIINPLFNKLIFNPLSFVLAKVTKLVNWQHCKYQELRPYLEHLGSMDQRALLGMAKRMQEHNARDMLAQIKVPTLIIAGEDDFFTPIRISEEMYRLIPNVEMMTIPRGSHAAIIEQPDLINLRIDKFFREKLT